jgi:hypothetical protein
MGSRLGHLADALRIFLPSLFSVVTAVAVGTGARGVSAIIQMRELRGQEP